MNNSSAVGEAAEDVQPCNPWLLTISVNISMAVVALALMCHISALFILCRSTLRRKIMTPFMANISAISIVLSACGYSVTLGINFKLETENNTKSVFLCSWVAFVSLLSKSAYAFTLCTANVVSKLAADRCARGATQQITKASTIIFFIASWLYSIVISGAILFEDSLYALSGSQMSCQLNWPSQESRHFLYNVIVIVTTLLLPMVVCFVMQYLCVRIWKKSHSIENPARRRGLKYRRKLNRMVIALTLFFFVSELPHQVGNVVAMTTGYYTYTCKTAFVLELLAQSNVLYAPFVYLFLNTSYRITLKQMLMGSTEQPPLGTRANQGRTGVADAANRRRPDPKRVVRVHPSPQDADATTEQPNGRQSSYTTSFPSKTPSAESSGNENANTSTHTRMRGIKEQTSLQSTSNENSINQ